MLHMLMYNMFELNARVCCLLLCRSMSLDPMQEEKHKQMVKHLRGTLGPGSRGEGVHIKANVRTSTLGDTEGSLCIRHELALSTAVVHPV